MLKSKNTDKRNQRPLWMEQYAALMDWKANIKMSSLPEVVYGFNANHFQAGRFVLVNRLILNCIWQGKGSKTSKSFQKEHSCIIYAKLPWSCNVVWVKVQTYELNRTVQNRLMVCQPISTKVQRKMNLYIWYIWFLYGLYMVTYKNQLKWITFTSLNVKTENC